MYESFQEPHEAYVLRAKQRRLGFDWPFFLSRFAGSDFSLAAIFFLLLSLGSVRSRKASELIALNFFEDILSPEERDFHRNFIPRSPAINWS